MKNAQYDELIGRTVVGWVLSADRTTLKLALEEVKGLPSSAKLETEGDCCSQTWIESADLPENLKGMISSVEDIDMPAYGNTATLNRDLVECVAYYGLKITTNEGSCVIDYRNDSNGYYGGSMFLVME